MLVGPGEHIVVIDDDLIVHNSELFFNEEYFLVVLVELIRVEKNQGPYLDLVDGFSLVLLLETKLPLVQAQVEKEFDLALSEGVYVPVAL